MTVNEDFWAGVASGARPLPGWSSDSQGMGSSGTSTTSDPAHVSVLTPCYTFGVLPAFTRNRQRVRACARWPSLPRLYGRPVRRSSTGAPSIAEVHHERQWSPCTPIAAPRCGGWPGGPPPHPDGYGVGADADHQCPSQRGDPDGDELLYLVSGGVHVVLEGPTVSASSRSPAARRSWSPGAPGSDPAPSADTAPLHHPQPGVRVSAARPGRSSLLRNPRLQLHAWPAVPTRAVLQPRAGLTHSLTAAIAR